MKVKIRSVHRIGALSTCVLLVGQGVVLQARSQTPSTSEDKKRVVQIAHELESKPLDESLTKEVQWAMRWLLESHELHANVCTRVLGDSYTSKYQYSSAITAQLILSSGAYMLENPERANDDLAVHMAGVQGVLKAYASIMRDQPKTRSKPLNELAQ